MKKYVVWAIVIVITLALIGFIVMTLKKTSHVFPPSKPAVLNSKPIYFYGQIEPEGKVINLCPKTAGIIRILNFKEGDFVTKGELLITFDDTVEKRTYESSLAQIEFARKSSLISKDTFKRDSVLYVKEMIPEADYLQLKYKKEIDEANVKVKIRDSETNLAMLNDRYLYAPQDGFIYKSDLHLGEAFNPTDQGRLQMGSSKLEIVGDLETLWIGKLSNNSSFKVYNAETGIYLGSATLKSTSRFLRPKTTYTESPTQKVDASYQEIILSFHPSIEKLPIGLQVKVETTF